MPPYSKQQSEESTLYNDLRNPEGTVTMLMITTNGGVNQLGCALPFWDDSFNIPPKRVKIILESIKAQESPQPMQVVATRIAEDIIALVDNIPSADRKEFGMDIAKALISKAYKTEIQELMTDWAETIEILKDQQLLKEIIAERPNRQLIQFSE